MSSELRSDHDIYQLVVINDEQYALPVHSINSVLALENLLRLPGTPQWVNGVVHIRNAIVPVVNLNDLIDVRSPEHQSTSPLLILLCNPLNSRRWLALCVTDLTSIMLKNDLDDMPSNPSTHPCLVKIVQHKSQKIHLLDINRLFEQLMKEQD